MSKAVDKKRIEDIEQIQGGAIRTYISSDGGDTWHPQKGSAEGEASIVLAAGSQAGLVPRTSGGLNTYRLLSAASTNSNNIKASAGQVYGWYISNTNAAVRVVKLYDKATAPTVGTDTPKITLVIPGDTAGAGANVEFANGIPFASGIGIGITTGVPDADTGAVAADEVVVNLFYK